MDFVVVGFGVGALGVLLGVLLRGWLAGRRERAASRAADPAAAAYERANAAECRGAGQAFLAAGGAVVLATVGGLAGGLDDRGGALLVTTTATVAALGIILSGFLHRSRNPMPPRPRRQAAAVGAGDVPELDIRLAAAMPAPVGSTPAVATDALDADEAATDAEEAGEPSPDGSIAPSTGLDAVPEPEPHDTEADEAVRREVGPAANGHPSAAGAEQGTTVAFVGRGARTGVEDGAASNDDDGADER